MDHANLPPFNHLGTSYHLPDFNVVCTSNSQHLTDDRKSITVVCYFILNATGKLNGFLQKAALYFKTFLQGLTFVVSLYWSSKQNEAIVISRLNERQLCFYKEIHQSRPHDESGKNTVRVTRNITLTTITYKIKLQMLAIIGDISNCYNHRLMYNIIRQQFVRKHNHLLDNRDYCRRYSLTILPTIQFVDHLCMCDVTQFRMITTAAPMNGDCDAREEVPLVSRHFPGN